MWVIFRENKSVFTHMDKNVFAVVEDKDVLEIQDALVNATGGTPYPLLRELDCLQNFVGNDYFAKHYVPMTPHTNMTVPREPSRHEMPTVSLFRDAAPRNPYNTSQ